jgi:hypothetical protein
MINASGIPAGGFGYGVQQTNKNGGQAVTVL